jgi:O-antigen ligase
LLERLQRSLVIFLVFWISLIPHNPTPTNSLAFVRILLLIGFFLLLLQKRKAIFKLSDAPLWILLATFALNLFFTQDKRMALQMYLDLSLPLLIVYYLVGENFQGKRFFFLAGAISWASSLVALLGVWELLFVSNPIYSHLMDNPYYARYVTGFVRPVSTQLNPSPLGSYLLGCLPFNFLMFRVVKGFSRFMAGAGLVTVFVVLIFTFSRGAFSALMALVIIYLFIKKKYIGLLLVGVSLSALLLFASNLPYPFSRLSREGIIGPEGSGLLSDYRMERYRIAYRMLKDHPFTGIGFWHFKLRFEEYDINKHRLQMETMIADNTHLTILSEAGTIGFLGFIIFVFCSFKKGLKSYRKRENLSALVALMSFLGIFFNMGGYELFYWPGPYFCFCLAAGCIEAQFRNDTNKAGLKLPTR